MVVKYLAVCSFAPNQMVVKYLAVCSFAPNQQLSACREANCGEEEHFSTSRSNQKIYPSSPFQDLLMARVWVGGRFR
jgi:hypothetical protein